MDQLTGQMAGICLARKKGSVVGPVRDMRQLSAAQLADLRSAPVCALDCEGVGLSRAGPISIVSLATETTCFLFDVLASQRTPGMVTLLKVLLADPGWIKVIHDSEMDVDALHHQLNITVMNVRDTQAWDQVLTGHRSNLNNTLVRYGCLPNGERDRDLYTTKPAIWAIRPIKQRLIDYASRDAQSLLQLREQQRAKAAETPGAEVRCVEASRQAADFFKKFMTTTKISNMGYFIGPEGTNMARLAAQVPGCHYQRADPRCCLYGDDNLLVYADDEEQLTKAVCATAPYI
ncbi:hypothetical protein FOA52_000703 [Chlamydomonas sp. UWO 241]|nr:hypothetical protein FOA52_000703 [Chlamydomonas sp. UWO 241]